MLFSVNTECNFHKHTVLDNDPHSLLFLSIEICNVQSAVYWCIFYIETQSAPSTSQLSFLATTLNLHVHSVKDDKWRLSKFALISTPLVGVEIREIHKYMNKVHCGLNVIYATNKTIVISWDAQLY